jgi:hypothetical protein
MSLAGVVAYAPVWVTPATWGATIRPEAVAAFHLTTREAGGLVAYALYYFYSHGEVLDGPGGGLAMFQPQRRDVLTRLMTTECGDQVPVDVVQLGDTPDQFYDAAFIDEVGGCALFGTCTTPLAMTWHQRFLDDRPAVDPQGVPMALLAGSRDEAVTPDRAQCGIDKIERDLAAAPGATASLVTCGDPEATHGSIITRNAAWAVAWMAARFGGGPEPSACTSWVPLTCGTPPSND